MSSPPDFEDLSRAELKALVAQLLGEVAELKHTMAAQRDEIARLKGLKGRPEIKPSGMEKASQAPTRERAAGKRRRKRTDLTIHEERILKAGPVPPGSRFKGYQTFLVQDLVLRPHVVRLQRERWLAPDGQTITAAMPSEIVGHFGSGLRRFVLAQDHQGQVTIPRLLKQLSRLGPVLGSCGAPRAQARGLHRRAARGAAAHALPDLVVLPRSEGLCPRALSATTSRTQGAL